MFDKYLIVEDSLRNVGPSDAPTGFAVDVMLGYYRGLGLSMVEALDLAVDGDAIGAEKVTLDAGDGPLGMAELATAYDRRWGFGEPATLTVARPGGLAAGPHDVALVQRLRISYMPFPSVNTDRKLLALIA